MKQSNFVRAKLWLNSNFHDFSIIKELSFVLLLLMIPLGMSAQGGTDPCVPDIEGIKSNLPEMVDFQLTGFPGTPDQEFYFNINVYDPNFDDSSGFLSGNYGAFCVDRAADIGTDPISNAAVVSSLELYDGTNNLEGRIANPLNFDKVNWVLNQDLLGQGYTYGHIQYAIWILLGEEDDCGPNGADDCNNDFLTTPNGSWGTSDVDKANEIVNMANNNGVGFEPGCDEFIGIVLIPDPEQAVIIPVKVPPACTASAGTLAIDEDPVTLIGGTATVSATHVEEPVVPDGYCSLYVLTSGFDDLVIQQLNTTEPSFDVTMPGEYTIHTFVFPCNLDVEGAVIFGETTGFDVLTLIDGLCADLDAVGAQVTVEECTASAGTLAIDEDPMTLIDGMATISATHVDDPVVPDGYCKSYVLTSGFDDLVIQQLNTTEPSFDVTMPGEYTIHTFVFPCNLDVSGVTFGQTTGGDVLNLIDGLCADLDAVGAQVTVEECTASAGTLAIDEDPVTLIDGMATISATHVDDPVVPDGYCKSYVLTSGFDDLVIQQLNDTEPSFDVTMPGEYTIHTFVFPCGLDVAGVVTFGETTGFDVLALIDGLCADLDAVGAQVTVEDNDCGECDGKVTELKLQYNGTDDAVIRVETKKKGEDGSKEVYSGNVAPGGMFSFFGNDKKGTLGPEITIYVGESVNTKIHTSCSQPIGPGLISGDFEVISGTSRHGGELCPVDTPPVDDDCECDGKVTELELKYNGVDAADIRVETKKKGEFSGTKIVFEGNVAPGGMFSFVGNDKKGTLGTEITIYVGESVNTKIHTSCSVPIGPGLISGDFEVISGSSRNGGELCPVSTSYRVVAKVAAEISEFSVKAWPNPANNQFNIKVLSPNVKDNVNIEVFDMRGRVIHKNQFNGNSDYSFGENLRSGLYFVRIQQGDTVETIKLMKQ